MAVCSHCGNANNESQSFCTKCGQKLAESSLTFDFNNNDFGLASIDSLGNSGDSDDLLNYSFGLDMPSSLSTDFTSPISDIKSSLDFGNLSQALELKSESAGAPSTNKQKDGDQRPNRTGGGRTSAKSNDSIASKAQTALDQKPFIPTQQAFKSQIASEVSSASVTIDDMGRSIAAANEGMQVVNEGVQQIKSAIQAGKTKDGSSLKERVKAAEAGVKAAVAGAGIAVAGAKQVVQGTQQAAKEAKKATYQLKGTVQQVGATVQSAVTAPSKSSETIKDIPTLLKDCVSVTTPLCSSLTRLNKQMSLFLQQSLPLLPQNYKDNLISYCNRTQDLLDELDTIRAQERHLRVAWEKYSQGQSLPGTTNTSVEDWLKLARNLNERSQDISQKTVDILSWWSNNYHEIKEYVPDSVKLLREGYTQNNYGSQTNKFVSSCFTVIVMVVATLLFILLLI